MDFSEKRTAVAVYRKVAVFKEMINTGIKIIQEMNLNERVKLTFFNGDVNFIRLKLLF